MYRAKETFWAPGNRHIIKGDLIAPHDSVVKGREGLFEEVVIPRALQPSETPDEPGTKQPEQTDDGKTGGETGPSEPAAADSGSTPAAAAASAAPAAAKKTTAKKTTTAAAARKPAAGGDAK